MNTILFKSLSGYFKYLEKPEVQFRLMTSLKITLIALMGFVVMSGFLFVFLKMDLVFFQSFDLSGLSSFEETFYDFLIQKILDFVAYLFILIVIISIIGLYASDILLRPFKQIGDYCELKSMDGDAIYNPEFFSGLKLMTGFSEFFFSIVESARVNGHLSKILLPLKYTKIRKPVFEGVFFLNFSLYIITVTIFSSLFIYMFTVDLHQGVIELARETLKHTKEVNTFLYHQEQVLNYILIVVLIIHVLTYLVFALHLYSKVSAPAFAIFATMRSFLKGNYKSRVHLLGYGYLRDDCRKFNKYLDKVSNSFVKIVSENS